MSVSILRCEGDKQLAEKLGKHRVVKQVVASLDKQGPLGARRQLLATSLKLTKRMAPELSHLMEDCRKRLSIDIEVENYVYNSPQMNAACVTPEDDRLILRFSSALLEKLDEQEMRFVVGHELGHYMFQHHDIPIGYLVKGPAKVSPQLAIDLFAWSRFAEISADRAGAYCCEDRDATGRALFKLASGVSSKWLTIELDDFVAQADELEKWDRDAEERNQQDWFMTHPFSPLRVKALQLFQKHRNDTTPDQLEAEVSDVLGVMAPSYLEKTDQTSLKLRQLLFAAGIATMCATGYISDAEIAAFERLLGDDSYSKHLDPEKIMATVPERLAAVRAEASTAQLVQLMRDLTLVAWADSQLDPAQAEYLRQIGEQLGLESALVETCMYRDLDLD